MREVCWVSLLGVSSRDSSITGFWDSFGKGTFSGLSGKDRNNGKPHKQRGKVVGATGFEPVASPV